MNLLRHEALHDDVTEHERTKEKRFEEEMEVTNLFIEDERFTERLDHCQT